jgi:hypothetical protein
MAGQGKNADGSPVEMMEASAEASLFSERDDPKKFGRGCEFRVAIV